MKAGGACGREMECTKAGGVSMGAEGAWTLSGAGGLGATESALPVAGGGEEHELDLGCVMVSWR